MSLLLHWVKFAVMFMTSIIESLPSTSVVESLGVIGLILPFVWYQLGRSLGVFLWFITRSLVNYKNAIILTWVSLSGLPWLLQLCQVVAWLLLVVVSSLGTLKQWVVIQHQVAETRVQFLDWGSLQRLQRENVWMIRVDLSIIRPKIQEKETVLLPQLGPWSIPRKENQRRKRKLQIKLYVYIWTFLDQILNADRILYPPAK